MSCLVPPGSLEEFFGVINRCATAYGGERWIETALLGLLTICVAGLLIIALVAMGRAR